LVFDVEVDRVGCLPKKQGVELQHAEVGDERVAERL
ncbi:hypothetical protein LCGC14_1937390, partial [marine sediment metagenome]